MPRSERWESLPPPKAHLLVLVAATQVPDLLFFAFEATGIEHQAVTHMDFSQGLTYLSPARIPFSHGLLMWLVWSAMVGAIAFVFYRHRRTSVISGLAELHRRCGLQTMLLSSQQPPRTRGVPGEALLYSGVEALDYSEKGGIALDEPRQYTHSNPRCAVQEDAHESDRRFA